MNNTKYEMLLVVTVGFVILISASSFPDVFSIPFGARKVTWNLKQI